MNNQPSKEMLPVPTMSYFFEGAPVRSLLIGEAPWFVAKDVAVVLGYAKPGNAVARHCKAATTIPKQSGGSLTVIPESDVYRLVFRSKLPAAEKFEEWVTSGVLPSIHRRGMYVEGQQKVRAELLDVLAKNIREKALPALQEFDRITDQLHWLTLKRPDEYTRRVSLAVDSVALDFDLPRSLVVALTQHGMSAVLGD